MSAAIRIAPVNAGFGGQSFIEATLPKIEVVRQGAAAVSVEAANSGARALTNAAVASQ